MIELANLQIGKLYLYQYLLHDYSSEIWSTVAGSDMKRTGLFKMTEPFMFLGYGPKHPFPASWRWVQILTPDAFGWYEIDSQATLEEFVGHEVL